VTAELVGINKPKVPAGMMHKLDGLPGTPDHVLDRPRSRRRDRHQGEAPIATVDAHPCGRGLTLVPAQSSELEDEAPQIETDHCSDTELSGASGK
jgi:hypothetical protein